MPSSRRLRELLAIARDKLAKITVQPVRYRSPGTGYDAKTYWGDRLRKHGVSLRGVGKEGLSEERNLLEYERSFLKFSELMSRAGVDLRGKRVLEIGPGNGFWLERLHGEAASWDAADITDVLFPVLKERFPKARFHQLDICESSPGGKFDAIMMIEVLQHIVHPERLRRALGNIGEALEEDGVFVLGPVFGRAGRKLFHVRHWSLQEILEQFPGYQVEIQGPFRGGKLLILRKRRAEAK